MWAVWEFVEKYFIRPVYTGEGYNIFNTLAYVALFIGGLYGVKWLLKKWKIKINNALLYSLLPYFIFAGLIRALEDFWPVKHWLLITPGIYLLMIALVGGLMVATGKNLKNMKKIGWALAGVATGLVVAAAYSTHFNIGWLITIGGIAVIITFIVWKIFPTILNSTENRLVTFSQILDGSVSAISISLLGYQEQHVVSGLVMQGSPFNFLLLKIVLVVVSLHLLNKKKSEWNWLLKISILLLGMSPGIRDLARVFIGV